MAKNLETLAKVRTRLARIQEITEATGSGTGSTIENLSHRFSQLQGGNQPEHPASAQMPALSETTEQAATEIPVGVNPPVDPAMAYRDRAGSTTSDHNMDTDMAGSVGECDPDQDGGILGGMTDA
ncbi:hypothetical protein O1611_g438 [Lasiodiplodia mahajangana]|uniref:Uncharacterized protein n=1 Tax=Lasiodiplodia mahajangana TaxID=1108764 RepID=A0ACC2K0B2_9PEZI|nr:hypothetical protein O1611_g438 [Lasiodiplodia mahajangana]